MPLKVLVVPDKFKGSLTAHSAAEAIALGWRRARPSDRLDLLPMSDGGDGFGRVMAELLGARALTVMTVDAAHRPCRAHWWWQPKSKTAVIESAEVIGLAKHRGFHPYELDTFGLGAVLQAAAKKGARRCLIGVGGSASMDGGFGLARSLGWQFLDGDGKPIESWIRLDSLVEFRAPKEKSRLPKLIVVVDVLNPLLGPRGCARVYGPQKGLIEFAVADRCLGRLAKVARRQLRRNCAIEPGAGAAGGLGFGFASFLGAPLRHGFEEFARQANLWSRLRRADVVISGEGSIDHSSFMGKGVGQIARTCFKLKIPCLGVAGIAKPGRRHTKYFRHVRGLTEIASLEESLQKPAHWLAKLAKQMAHEFDSRG